MSNGNPVVRRMETVTGGHWYLDTNDRPIPGVTTILQSLPKQALFQWKLRKAVDLALKGEEAWKGIPDGVKPTTWLIDAGEREALAAAAVGTGAHNFAEQYMLGNNPDLDVLPKKEKYHAECFLQFVKDHEPEPILIEKVVTHIDSAGRPLYCGTIDILAKMKDGLIWSIDWKASSSQPRPSHALQAAAYVHATHWIDENGELQPMPKAERAAVVLLNGGTDGNGYRAYELDASPVVFSVFKSLLRIHNFTKIEERCIIGEL